MVYLSLGMAVVMMTMVISAMGSRVSYCLPWCGRGKPLLLWWEIFPSEITPCVLHGLCYGVVMAFLGGLCTEAELTLGIAN
jgi:hypothetical protein